MARIAFPLVLQSPISGSALVGATATITKHVIGASLGSGAEAEIFLTDSESTKVSGNKILTDDTGRWTQGAGASPAYAQYWLPEGTYDILISGSGLSSVYITRELVSGANRVGERLLTVREVTGNITANSGDLIIDPTNGAKVKLPASPSVNSPVGVYYANATEGSLILEGNGNTITGPGLSAGSCHIAPNTGVTVIWDGSFWRMVAGEPQKAQPYEARVSRTSGTAYVASGSRPAFVTLEGSKLEAVVEVWAIVGSETIAEDNRAATTGGVVNVATLSFMVPAGVTWTPNANSGAALHSRYLLL